MVFRTFKIAAYLAGWILFGLLAWHFRARLSFKVGSSFPQYSQQGKWEQLVEAKSLRLRQNQWQDERPLALMLGDSQIEMGNWYDLFQGRFTIRNAGLSQAKVADIIRLAEEISRINPATVIIMCGINDLGSGRPAETVSADYERLLDQVCKTMKPY